MIKDILNEEMLKKGRFWTHPWGLIRGCSAVSPGCAHCWLVRMTRLTRNGGKYLTADRIHFNSTVDFIEGKLTEPIASRHRKPRVWAVWSDFFHEAIPDHCRDTAMSVMRNRPKDYFLLVTKRPQIAARWRPPAMLRNVLILVTMEDQRQAYIRSLYADRLVRMGWRLGILTEPMLEPITIHPPLMANLTWVICGPETGPGKRPFDPDWALSLRNQAEGAGIPFYYKKGELDGKFYLGLPNF